MLTLHLLWIGESRYYDTQVTFPAKFKVALQASAVKTAGQGSADSVQCRVAFVQINHSVQ